MIPGSSPDSMAVEATDSVLSRWPDADAVLSAHERRRRDAFRRLPDARDYAAAHLLAREAVARSRDQDARTISISQTCPTCERAGHGPPSTDGGYVSWSHTRGTVAAVAGHQPVGIDVERTDSAVELSDTLLGSVLTDAESAAVRAAADPRTDFLRAWVRKESLVKLGATRLDDLASFDVSDTDLLARSGWVVQDLSGEGWVAAASVTR